jgi:hypothetical protein
VKFLPFQKLFDRFVNENITINELQSRLETMLIPDSNAELAKIRESVINELEEILFCVPKSYQKQQAINVLEEMLNKTKELN